MSVAAHRLFNVLLVGLLAVTTGAGCSMMSSAQGDVGLRRMAILPAAYAAPGGGLPCTMCPEQVELQPTSADQALLVTGFFFEALRRHPRYTLIPNEEVAALVAAKGEREAVKELVSQERIDVVLVPALRDMHERVGSRYAPERPAGASVYAALLNARTGEVLWSGGFDQDEKPVGTLRRKMNELVRGQGQQWHSGEGFAAGGVDKVVRKMIEKIRHR